MVEDELDGRRGDGGDAELGGTLSAAHREMASTSEKVALNS
jgi:hypothetical protein